MGPPPNVLFVHNGLPSATRDPLEEIGPQLGAECTLLPVLRLGLNEPPRERVGVKAAEDPLKKARVPDVCRDVGLIQSLGRDGPELVSRDANQKIINPESSDIRCTSRGSPVLKCH